LFIISINFVHIFFGSFLIFLLPNLLRNFMFFIQFLSISFEKFFITSIQFIQKLHKIFFILVNIDELFSQFLCSYSFNIFLFVFDYGFFTRENLICGFEKNFIIIVIDFSFTNPLFFLLDVSNDLQLILFLSMNFLSQEFKVIRWYWCMSVVYEVFEFSYGWYSFSGSLTVFYDAQIFLY